MATAHSEPEPYTESAEDTSYLITTLVRLAKEQPKLVRSTARPAPADPARILRSWKMNEYKYATIPCPFPTLARGLFTEWVPAPVVEGLSGEEEGAKREVKERVKGLTDDVLEGVVRGFGEGEKVEDANEDEDEDYDTGESPTESKSKGMHRIIARGYDKFFNIGEVPWTEWDSLERHTSAPYDLTLKSNGCIIFIAALDSSKLVVASKHAIGPNDNMEISHAQMGEKWLRKHLAAKGKTEAVLAARLLKENLTAVAELCDDSFEEHVLPYPTHLSGLHLHGLNRNTAAFSTLPPAEVEAFAHEWGFFPTPTTTLPTIVAVREFSDEVAKTGMWNGEAVEGFVVRTRVAVPSGGNSRAKASPPYPPSSNFFFKIKFQEPYLMYRDWREITKMILTQRNKGQEINIPKSKLQRKETILYRQWVEAEIEKRPRDFEGFAKGRGIIATRKRFLSWMENEEAVAALEKLSPTQVAKKREVKDWKKTVIVPIAVPGCGKTSVGVALSHIFGWAHTQSDDVMTKKTASKFEGSISDLLRKNDVVFADRNNHLVTHRTGIRTVASKFSGGPVRLIALHWPLSLPLTTVHRICGDRVAIRGDNHQSLRADEDKGHEEIIWKFITGAEELDENEVDDVIEMDVREDLETSIRRAAEELARLLNLDFPSTDQIADGFDAARGYKTTLRKDMTSARRDPTRYFGFLIEIDLEDVVTKALLGSESATGAQIWGKLKKDKRIIRRPHITIVHAKNLPGEQQLWDRCYALRNLELPPLFKFNLGSVVFNDRVMAISVDSLSVDGDTGGGEGAELLKSFSGTLVGQWHITVGTVSEDVPPYEGSHLVRGWRSDRAFAESIELKGATAAGRVKGLS
ncbi:hypothetical protein BOTBODRAFT_57305 [Botryobasidium botryosum FD-172 SS1]|uniref:tRNA ligase n=1 Tax=Botryobasidium botryosum (strain FD-172 SS1) TaxID=930990 RepID=A0A067M9Y7_BOTB1|nr:hypothetical protein BOTBODRAFT_57305 [Botryobasidium botryosum FD-172 SS1]